MIKTEPQKVMQFIFGIFIFFKFENSIVACPSQVWRDVPYTDPSGNQVNVTVMRYGTTDNPRNWIAYNQDGYQSLYNSGPLPSWFDPLNPYGPPAPPPEPEPPPVPPTPSLPTSPNNNEGSMSVPSSTGAGVGSTPSPSTGTPPATPSSTPTSNPVAPTETPTQPTKASAPLAPSFLIAILLFGVYIFSNRSPYLAKISEK